MTKLTKKQFVERLTGSAFISATWNIPAPQLIKVISESKEIPVIYDVVFASLTSRDIISVDSKGNKKYRNLVGKNEFFIDKHLLIHKRLDKPSGMYVTLINITKDRE